MSKRDNASRGIKISFYRSQVRYYFYLNVVDREVNTIWFGLKGVNSSGWGLDIVAQTRGAACLSGRIACRPEVRFSLTEVPKVPTQAVSVERIFPT